MRGESVTFCSTVMCGNRLKAWKTMPMCWRSSLTSSLSFVRFCAVDRDRAGVDLLEQVDAAQQRRLARARGADQADDVVRTDVEADVRQHLVVAERLGDVLDLDEALGAHPAARSRSSRWRIRLSVKRASGIVRITKRTAATV